SLGGAPHFHIERFQDVSYTQWGGPCVGGHPSGDPEGRIRFGLRTERVRQEYAYDAALGPGALLTGPDGGWPPQDRWTELPHRHRISAGCPVGMAERSAERDDPGGDPQTSRGSCARAGKAIARNGVAEGFRIRLSQRAFRWHAPTRLHLPRLVAQAAAAAHGRTVRSIGCHD